ncbi:MAG: hypothetical protein U0941_16725 [Planctomycetaceae bacterium]
MSMRSGNTKCVSASLSLKGTLIALVFMQTTAIALGDSTEWCPPYGTRMPPDRFAVVRGAKRGALHPFPADYSAYRYKAGDRIGVSLGMTACDLRTDQPLDFRWNWLWHAVVGEVLMIGGQIYRFENEEDEMVFTRISNHPLSRDPRDSVHLFAISTSGGLGLSDLSDSRLINSLDLETVEFDTEHQTPESPGRAKLRIHCADEDSLLTPALEEDFQQYLWVRTGQYIETERWTLRVTRIVFPDRVRGISGWVEVRVSPARTPQNRPPAPSVSGVAITESLAEDEIERMFCPPIGHRMPPNHIRFNCTAEQLQSYPGYVLIIGDVLYFSGHGRFSPARIKSLEWMSTGPAKDGQLVMLGGQIYRFDAHSPLLTNFSPLLTRFANHPLSHEPKEAARLLAVPLGGSVSIFATRKDADNLRLDLNRLDPDQQTPTSPGRADFQVRSKSLLAPVPGTGTVNVSVRTGQYIETTSHRLKVTRIVFPSPDSNIGGWVELRVEKARRNSDGPPSPPVPQDPPEVPKMPEVCPPIGRKMPPDQLRLVEDGRKKNEFEDYPAEWSIERNQKGRLTKVYLVNQGENLPEEFNDFAWSWDSDVKDGQVLMIGGQVYRCDTMTLTFSRIPNHPLSLQPQAAVRLLALNRQGSLEIDPPLDGPKARERLSSLRFYLTGFDPEDQTPTSPGRARLEMPVHDENEIPIPSSDQTENPKLHFWVRAGQFIETCSWLLKVTRIVFPDQDQGIEGWVEFRIEPNRPPENRPPAPALTED